MDFNAPDVVEKISKSTVFIDHHVQSKINNEYVIQINPVIDGKYFRELCQNTTTSGNTSQL